MVVTSILTVFCYSGVKSASNLFNVLLQVMDNGSLTDANGRKVDFRNVV